MLKKNATYEGRVSALKYPSGGIVNIEGADITIKGALPQQKINFRLSKNHPEKKEGQVLEVLERAPYENESFCEHFGSCGGCARQTVPYDHQLKLKKEAVNNLFEANQIPYHFETVLSSPEIFEYRNKMEYSFGNEQKGGILNLGMHKKGRFYDVVSIPQCHLVDGDYRLIVATIETLIRERDWQYFNRNTGRGLLRHVVVRKGFHTGEILVGISTSSEDFDETVFTERLLALPLEGKIVGILRLVNDSLGDAVKPSPGDKVLYGRDYYIEKLMGLTFEVSFFSFFQTNTQAAAILYTKAMDMLPGIEGKVLYDLFSGTGTIGQIAGLKAKAVYGIEIVADAVAAANANAKRNGLEHCTFLAGDVFDVLSEVPEKPDVIVVDPPRGGMMPKTVERIATYGVDEILYISCNPKTMAENLLQFQEQGYQIKEGCLVDLYPHTDHVEAVVKLERR